MTSFKSRNLLLLGTAIASLLTIEANASENYINTASKTLNLIPISAEAGVQVNNSIGQGALLYVQRVADRGIGIIASPGMTEAQRRASFATLLDNSFDMDTIGRFALGVHWRNATPAQKAEYLKLFRQMIIAVYSNRFNDYDGQSLIAKSFRMGSATDTIVNSLLKQKDGSPDVLVDWRVRYKNGSYKIVDVIVEGVSMSVTQRSDFSSVIQQGGGNIDALLDTLRQSR